MGYPRRLLRIFTPSAGGRIHRNQWQLSNGMGGSFAVESVAGLAWNTHTAFTPTSANKLVTDTLTVHSSRESLELVHIHHIAILAIFHVRCQNMYEGDLSADALGITACLYAYSHLSFSTGAIAREYARHYHLLREFMMDHPEVGEILGATD